MSVQRRTHFKNSLIIAADMEPYNDRTALLLFSRSPHEEALVKPHLAPHQGVKLAKVMIRQTLRTMRATQLPVVTCFSPQQTGATFGERLANAVEEVFAQGYERVIVIGNDIQHLRRSDILAAKTHLDTHDWVVGPATDGGAYLIGIHRAAYTRDTFVPLAWETPQLLGELLEVATQQARRVYTLSTLSDIDNAADFQRFLQHIHTGSALWRVFRVWLRGMAPRVVHRPITLRSSSIQPTRLLRGPPLGVRFDSFL